MVAPSTIAKTMYGWEETTFGVESSSIDKSFGHGVAVSGLARKNNVKRILGLGVRNAEVLQELQFDGAVTVNFALSNPWFFRGVLGATATVGSDPSTHTFSESNTIESFTITDQVDSDTVHNTSLLGCKFINTTISFAVGEEIKVKCDVPFVDEDVDATNDTRIPEALDLYTFAQGTLDLPSGSTLAYVQSGSVSINNLGEPVLGLGSRLGQEHPVKAREYGANVSMNFGAQADVLDKFYGSSTGPNSTVAEIATLTLTFTNGLTGANERSITLTFTGVKIDEHNLPQSPTELIIEDWTAPMRSLEVVAVNSTTTIP